MMQQLKFINLGVRAYIGRRPAASGVEECQSDHRSQMLFNDYSVIRGSAIGLHVIVCCSVGV